MMPAPSLSAFAILFSLIFVPAASFLVCFLALVGWVQKKWGLEPRHAISWSEHRWILAPAVVFLSLFLICLGYGVWVEPSDIEVTHTEIAVPRPVLGYSRFRIVHLSDLHIEGFGRRERRALDLVKRENPHVIVLTGDYLNRLDRMEDLVAFLRELNAPHGVYAAPGEWDHKFPMRRIFASAGRGTSWLADDWVKLQKDGRDLHIVGLESPSDRPLGEILEGMPSSSLKIVLVHRPEEADKIAQGSSAFHVDLALCGHTHGGQVCVPFYGPLLEPRNGGIKRERGLHRAGETSIYVNRGLGMEGGATPRVRLFSRPEVAVIDLVCEP